MKLALTGATGFVGQAVLDQAEQQGVEVKALTRRKQTPRRGVSWVPGNLDDVEALQELVRGSEAVIHVAGLVNAPDPAAFEAANVTGTLNLIEAAVAERVPRFAFVSSLAAREPELSAYGASKARAEKLVAASGLDWTIIRPPAVYGPRDAEMFELFRLARWGVIPMPAEGRSSLIHVADLARLLLALVPGGEDVTHRIFEPDDGRAGGWEHGELAGAIAAAMERRAFVPRLSRGALLRIAGADRFFRGTKAKLTPDRVNYMTHPDWVSGPDRAVPVSRWMPRIATGNGLKETAAWYRENRWL